MQIFSRDYNISIELAEEGVFSITCSLRDLFHDLILTQKVTIEKPTVLSGSLQVNKAPKEHCEKLKLLPEKLKGISLDKGFTKEVVTRLGGPDGCVNLVNMVLVSLPLAINSSWLYYAYTGKYSPEEIKIIEKQQMAGVCLGYPVDKDPQN